jgi:hypothetical protein
MKYLLYLSRPIPKKQTPIVKRFADKEYGQRDT